MLGGMEQGSGLSNDGGKLASCWEDLCCPSKWVSVSHHHGDPWVSWQLLSAAFTARAGEDTAGPQAGQDRARLSADPAEGC